MVSPSKLLTDDGLGESLQFLVRWELDNMQRVSRRFRNVYAKERDVLRQRRMIDKFTNHGYTHFGLTIRGAYRQRMVKVVTKKYQQRPTACSDSVRVFGDQMLELLRADPNLRARQSVLLVSNAVKQNRSKAELQYFATIWEGFSLEVVGKVFAVFYASVGLFTKCSALKVHGNLCLKWKDEGRRALAAAGLEAVRCPRIDFNIPCRDLTFESIVAYLFADACGLDAGEKRELHIMWLQFRKGDAADFTPARLRELIEERLDTLEAKQRMPRFSLTLGLLSSEDDPLHVEFDLMPAAGPGTESDHRQCSFTSKRVRQENDQWKIQIKVHCE